MKNRTTSYLKVLTGGALVLAITTAVYADENAAAIDTNSCPVTTFLTGTIPEAFTKGKFSLNARLRYEYADQEGGTPQAHAETLRTRFGFTTVPVYGFQAMIEGEDITAADKSTYAAGAGSPVARDVIADPTGTEMNQAWLGYSNPDWKLALKGGRQMLVLDNARFVGNVGWRQNMQTFDAAGLKLTPVKELEISYNYLWRVHRIFGNNSALAAATSDFKSQSHLFNAAYTVSPLAKVVGYAYLLDLKNDRGNSAVNSCASYGGYLTGTWTFDKDHKGTVGYRGEYAYQTDYADSLLSYDTDYYLAEVKATYCRFNAGVGYEVLGSDNGVGFKTPLATLHAFNGWADVFLATPPAGLKDLYVMAGVNLPGTIPVNFVYHKFDAATGGADFGQEYDLVASRKFGKNWTLLAKYARYDGIAAPAAFDKQVIWAEIEFNF